MYINFLIIFLSLLHFTLTIYVARDGIKTYRGSPVYGSTSEIQAPPNHLMPPPPPPPSTLETYRHYQDLNTQQIISTSPYNTFDNTASSSNNYQQSAAQQSRQNSQYRQQNQRQLNSLDHDKTECPSGATGQFAIPHDCKRFLNCWKGRGFIQPCAPGTVFNPDSLECDSPDKVNCASAEVHFVNKMEFGRLLDGNSGPNVPKQSIQDGMQVTCSPGVSGILPHPFICNKFLQCDRGRTHIMTCGPGTAFNDLMSVCDFPHKVNCGVRQIIDVELTEHEYDDTLTSGSSVTYNVNLQTSNQIDTNSHHHTTNYENNNRNPLHAQSYPHSNTGSHGYPHSSTQQTYFRPPPPPPPQTIPSTPTPLHHHYHHHHEHYQPRDPPQQPYRGQVIGMTHYPHPTQAQNTQSTVPIWTDQNSQGTNFNSHNTYTGYDRFPQNPGQGTINEQSNKDKSDNNNQLPSSSGARRTTTTRNPRYRPITETTRNLTQTIIPVFPQNTQTQLPFGKDTQSSVPVWTDQTSQGTNFNSHNIYTGHDRHPQNPVQGPVNEQSNKDKSDYNNQLPSSSSTARRTTTTRNPRYHPISDTSRNLTQTIIPVFPQNTQTQLPLGKDFEIEQGTVQQISPNNDLSASNSSTGSTTIFYAKPVDFDSEEYFNNIAGGDIPLYNRYEDAIPASSSKNQISTSRENRGRELNLHNKKPLEQLPLDYNANVRGFPQYPPHQNQSNFQGPITYSSPYSAVSLAHETKTRQEKTLHPLTNNQATVTTSTTPLPAIIFSRNGVSLNVDESQIVPIYTRPNTDTNNSKGLNSFTTNTVRPLTIITPLSASQIKTIQSTKIFPTKQSYPQEFNKQYYKTNENSDLNKEVDDEAAALPISDALKILLRTYMKKGDVPDDNIKKMESSIIQIENKIAQDKVKKQVEIISTGEQEHMNQGTIESRSQFHHSNPNHHHDHHHHHTEEFHRTHPHLPNPFSNNYNNSNNFKGHHTEDFHRTHTDFEYTTENPRREHTTAQTFSDTTTVRNVPIDPRVGNSNVWQLSSRGSENNLGNSQTQKPQVVYNNINRIGSGSINNNICQFDCGNGKCIKHFEVCDGVNNCGNRKDEEKCERLGYEVRLANKDGEKGKGRVEVKVNGKWGYICDDKFDMNDANVLCRELGFPLGASEIRGNSYYLPKIELMSAYNNVTFLMDEIDCVGNETSLRECDFKGWGVHDCNADEVVGVVCKVPIMKCPYDYWLCKKSMECIPTKFVCDNVPDCEDESDESNEVCNSKIEYRLVGGRLEGRVEVKYRNEWGSICDDDFGKHEAQVVCNALGFYGPAEVIKNAYGIGYGPIWLDQVMCQGNETCLDKCQHWAWGEHNCNHSEDVSIRCSIGLNRPTAEVNTGIKTRSSRPTEIEDDEDNELNYFLYNSRSSKLLQIEPKLKCGRYNPAVVDEEFEERELQRIIHGGVSKKGRHPWQATIRVKGIGTMSSHLCGAVLISRRHLLTAAHCISDYEKGAFFIRLGDHRTDEKDPYERDIFIHDWYIHDLYRRGHHMNNDIALIVMKEPIDFNDYIQPICLPDKNLVYESNKMCMISGWGSDKSGQSTPSKILRAAEIPILPLETCTQPEVYGRRITSGMFCAGYLDGKVDACDGDSGGPMVCQNGDTHFLYGITSWGFRCGYENKPGVYVKITEYLDWIKRKINLSIEPKD